ncbi:MAG TPA: hypothetical protein PKA64_22630, partial [Myxococcota bacterium]|nr:hypothetical protein [Myxococcota bacterium]
MRASRRWRSGWALALAAGLAPTSGWAIDFVGDFAPSAWSTTGIPGGQAGVDLGASTAAELHATYAVDLGSGGVSQRTAEFSVVPSGTGVVSFDWTYDYFHAWFAVSAELRFFYVDDAGGWHDFDVHQYTQNDYQSVSGSIVDMPVFQGQPFGFVVGGSNFDSTSILRGEVVLRAFVDDVVPLDCAGVAWGAAVPDMCGVCDDDPTNDCVQDCAGTWGGRAAEDMCGTCDVNPANDCAQDCAGAWGGPAVQDGCGTCDADPSNDCAQDCAGAWGGSAVEDGCGTCDADPSNDCAQDCAGAWGGSAV